jgi:hypothetical protein
MNLTDALASLPFVIGGIFELIPMLVVPVVFAIILYAVWYGHRKVKLRQEAMQKVATELGLVYQQVRPGDYDGRIGKYKLIQYGRNRQSSNFILATTDELSLLIFDHQYTTGSGKSKHVHRQTIAWVIGKQLQTPQFMISPESWFSRIADLFTKNDIDIPGDPEFSKKFLLIGENSDQIRQFFDLNRRQSLMKINMSTIECFPGELMFYRPNQQTDPAQLKSLMNEAFEIYQAFATVPVE